MMGAGKSTIGPLLAKALDRVFVDSDQEIERETGRSIAEIFASEGEPRFRALERAVIERLSGQPAVIALGGGALVQPGALGRLGDRGDIVYLRVSAEALLERLGDASSRPLLAGLDASERRQRLQALLEARTPCYEQADLVIEAEASEEEIVRRIVAALERLGSASGSEERVS